MHWEHMDGCDEYFYPDEDNNIVFEPLTDACRDFLEEMAVWYSEGLFGFNADRTGLAASNKLCSVWVGTYGSCLSTNGLLHDNGFEGEFDVWHVPIDGSTVGIALTFYAMYRAGRGELHLAKALALADQVTIMQHADGKIPTHWMNCRKAEDNFWLNCMCFSMLGMSRLSEIDENRQ